MADDQQTTEAALFWRLPIIRHVRYIVNRVRVNRHYAMWRQLGLLPVNADHDYAVLDAIWRGER